MKLGDVADFVGGGTPSKSNPDFYGSGIPWVTPKDMKSWVISTSQIEITKSGLDASSAKIVPAGSVLIVVRSGILKHTLPVALSSVDVSLNQDMKAIVVKPGIDSSYLARLVKASEPTVLGWVRATTADNFPVDNLKRLEFMLPPLDEQRRIAAVLDHVDALRTKRRESIDLIGSVVQSAFQSRFGDPGTWSSSWPMGTIGDMSESVQYGTSAKAGARGAWPMLRMGNVTDDGRLDLSDLKFIDLVDSDLAKYVVRRGDLLFNRTNSKEKVGKAAVVRTDRPLAIAGYLLRVRVKPQHSGEFISAYLRSRHGRAVRRGMAKAAVNQANINAKEMRSITIALPPADLQAAFAADVARVELARSSAERHLAELDTLFASLQSRAFAGELDVSKVVLPNQ
ncbi:restriction endonuclease subunit S [Myceligenerans indicum]|uniref:Restriction endonuclease n=1 Tax=Myceligenerans indicum TaxID=2593663 RepID=A0ABS1LPI5_9MICO|nr:restriction endonuclease subunit S [Myceligenerans indicum]MBL0888147.1 restriction endonuclease [Myceligenerans indicum]